MKTGRMTLSILALCAAAAAAAGAAVSAARAGTPAAESAPPQAGAPAYGPGPVFVVRLDDDDFAAISMWNNAYLRRCLQRAEAAGASLFVVELSTDGGFVNTAFRMSETLRGARGFRTAALVLNRAYSAGALVTLSCDDIYMRPGSVIGDALPVSIIPRPKKDAEEPAGGRGRTDIEKKQISALSAYFQQVAKEKGHSPELAAAMVDPDIEALGVSIGDRSELHTRETYDAKYPEPESRTGHKVTVLDSSDRLLTIGPEVAVRWGLARAEVADRTALLRLLSLDERQVVEFVPDWHERIGRFFSSLLVTALLVAIAILALYVELQKPSGLGAGVFLTALAVFFWANYLAGTAGPASIIVFLLGVALLVVEIFFIPGFTWTGISGIALMVIGMVAARLPADFFRPAVPEFAPPRMHLTGLLDALTPLAVGLAAGTVGIAVLMRFFPRLPLLNRLVLRTDLAGAVVTAAQAAGAVSPESMIGMVGTATTTLRPGGTAGFGDRLLDVVSDGDFIEAGTPVRIVSASGNRIVVRRN